MTIPISRRSPLFDPAIFGEEEVAEPSQLDPDSGTKQSLAAKVATSPMRYAGAFASKVPRFQQGAYYSASDPRQRAAKERTGSRVYTRALAGRDAIDVKPCTPGAQSLTFNSPVPRFKGGGNKDFLGLHPNFLNGKEMVRAPPHSRHAC